MHAESGMEEMRPVEVPVPRPSPAVPRESRTISAGPTNSDSAGTARIYFRTAHILGWPQKFRFGHEFFVIRAALSGLAWYTTCK